MFISIIIAGLITGMLLGFFGNKPISISTGKKCINNLGLRSYSRIGKIDRGANIRRIWKLIKSLNS